MIGTTLQDRDPRRLGPFVLISRLGAGGMGVVYLAERDGAFVAVKAIRPDIADDPEFRRRFAREVEAARMVSGRGTARLVDADPSSDMPWLATQYLEGPTLEAAVNDRGPLPRDQLLPFAVGLAEGLAAIHALKLVHRDLKPGNVMLTADGPKIIDFGIAFAVEATSATKSGLIVGTPGYISPEQIKGLPVSDRTDVFAWAGTVLYAACGRPPFGTGRSEAVLYRVLNAPAELSAVAPPVRDVVRRAFEQNPALRPSAASLVRELAGDAGDATQVATRLLDRTWMLPRGYVERAPANEPTRPIPGDARRGTRRLWRRVGIGAAAALAVGISGSAALSAMGSPEDRALSSSPASSALATPSASATPEAKSAAREQPSPIATVAAKPAELVPGLAAKLAALAARPEQCPRGSSAAGCSVQLTAFSPDSDTFYQPGSPGGPEPTDARIALVGPVTTPRLPMKDGTVATAQGIFLIAQVYMTSVDAYTGLSARDFSYATADPNEEVHEGGPGNQFPSDSRRFDLPGLLTSELLVAPGTSASGLVVFDVPEAPPGWSTGISWSRPSTPDGAGTYWEFNL